MATTPSSVHGEYGIDTMLSGYTIETESITRTPQVETVPDQKNAVANEIKYDTRWDLKLTVRGASEPTASDSFSYDGNTWAVGSIEKAGSYNGLRRFNISAHRFTNFPGAGQSSGQSSN